MDSDFQDREPFPLRDVHVRPVRDMDERLRWDRLVAERHYLSFAGFHGGALRHVALAGNRWLALVGRQSGEFSVGVRDRWIGWTPETRMRRLHLVASNSRFLILDAGGTANLAPRVLGPGLRRLSRDMLAPHGYPVPPAKTFVDPSRFAGTRHRATNRRPSGLTRGRSRLPDGRPRWIRSGQPKEVFVFDPGVERRCGGDGRGGAAKPARAFRGDSGLQEEARPPLVHRLLHDAGARHQTRRIPRRVGLRRVRVLPRRRTAWGRRYVPSKARGLWTVPPDSTFRCFFQQHAAGHVRRDAAGVVRRGGRRRPGRHGRQGDLRRLEKGRGRSSGRHGSPTGRTGSAPFAKSRGNWISTDAR